MKFVRYILILLASLSLVTCSKNDEDKEPWVFVDDTDGVDYHLYDLYTDKYGNEGLVVYVEEGSWGKYIQVMSVDETMAAWGPTGETILKGEPDSLWGTEQFSLAMLQCMKTRGIDHFPAQQWCDAKNCGEPYPRTGSWMLPSFYQMRFICGLHGSKVNLINSHLIALGKTPLSPDEYYWLSEEDYDGYLVWDDSDTADYDSDNRAVIVSPMIRGIRDKDLWIKKISYRVRAVKTICYVIYR